MTIRTIHTADNERAVRACWAAFQELRPHLGSEDVLVDRWRRQVGEGYEIAYASEGAGVVAVDGYGFLHTLAWGPVLYIDDLVARRETHGTGLGALLLDHLQSEARDRGCDAVHLDTGFERTRAHRAYLRNGFEHAGLHMSRPVADGGGTG